MFKQTPPGLRAAGRGRVPFPPDGHRELFEVALEERITAREAELDRATGRVDVDVPLTPEGPFRRRHRTPLPPVQDATGGNLPVVRNAWMVKHTHTEPNASSTCRSRNDRSRTPTCGATSSGGDPAAP